MPLTVTGDCGLSAGKSDATGKLCPASDIRYRECERCTWPVAVLSGIAKIKKVVGRRGLEPRTSALIDLEQSATDGGRLHETVGVIRSGFEEK